MSYKSIIFLAILLNTALGTLLASDLPRQRACCPGLFNQCRQRTLKVQLREAVNATYLSHEHDTINAMLTAVEQADKTTFEARKQHFFQLMQRKPSDWFQSSWDFSHPRGGYKQKYTIDIVAQINCVFRALNPSAPQPSCNQTLSEFVNHPLMNAVRRAYIESLFRADCTILSSKSSANPSFYNYLEFLARDWTHIRLDELEEAMKLELALEHVGTAHRYNAFLAKFTHRLPSDLNLLIGQLCFGDALSETKRIEKLSIQIEKRKKQIRANEFDVFFKRCMRINRGQENEPWPSFWESRLLRAFIYSGLAKPNAYNQAVERLKKNISSRYVRTWALAITAILVLGALPLGFYFILMSLQRPDTEIKLEFRILVLIIGLLHALPGLFEFFYKPLQDNRKTLKRLRPELASLIEQDENWPMLARATNQAQLLFEDGIDDLPNIIPMHSEV